MTLTETNVGRRVIPGQKNLGATRKGVDSSGGGKKNEHADKLSNHGEEGGEFSHVKGVKDSKKIQVLKLKETRL